MRPTRHNTLSPCSLPTPGCKKELIWNWLIENKIPCEKESLKAELVAILKIIAPSPLYEVDDIAKKHGHEILKTPPYHPELQPIELCWGIVKNHISRSCDFTLLNLKSLLEEGFAKVDATSCASKNY